jgi:hypothetical protein
MDPEERATSEYFLATDRLKFVLVLGLLYCNCGATKNEHLVLFKSSDIICIVTGIHDQLCSFTDSRLSYQEPLG